MAIARLFVMRVSMMARAWIPINPNIPSDRIRMEISASIRAIPPWVRLWCMLFMTFYHLIKSMRKNQ